jgi:signal peptidase I
MTSEKVSRRKPWLAGLLQVVIPGLGNVYAGRFSRGVVLHFLLQLIPLLVVFVLLKLGGLVSILLFLAVAVFAFVFAIYDGVRCAKQAGGHYRLARYNRVYVYLLFVVAALLLDQYVFLGFTRAYVFEASQTGSPSMEPTVLAGDRFLVDKTAYLLSGPQRGDLAVYHPQEFPDLIFLKRIVGMPGETIELRDRVVFINGKKIEEPYVRFIEAADAKDGQRDSLASTVIPPDAYFVMGDSRDNSNDSRYSGPVERKKIVGKAVTVFFSRDPQTGVVRWNRIGKVVN